MIFFWFSILFGLFYLLLFFDYQTLLTTNLILLIFYFGFFFFDFYSEPHHLTGIKCVTTTVLTYRFRKTCISYMVIFFVRCFFIHFFIANMKHIIQHWCIDSGLVRLGLGSMYSIWIYKIWQNVQFVSLHFVHFMWIKHGTDEFRVEQYDKVGLTTIKMLRYSFIWPYMLACLPA